MTRAAAFFDLDGTLLTVNSARLWIRRERRLGRATVHQVALAVACMAAYRIGVLDIEGALRAALATIRGLDERFIRSETEEWWREVRRFAAPGARAVLRAHRDRGEPLVLLTSSSRYAAELARDEFGLDAVLFQGYEVRDGRFTGEPLRPFCYGPGKVAKAAAWARESGVALDESSFYTDSSTDVPMLERVRHPRIVNPDLRLRLVARSRGWPILDWHG